MAFQLVERSVPALLVAAASLLVAQARMCEREFGPLENGAKPDLDKRLAGIFDAMASRMPCARLKAGGRHLSIRAMSGLDQGPQSCECGGAPGARREFEQMIL